MLYKFKVKYFDLNDYKDIDDEGVVIGNGYCDACAHIMNAYKGDAATTAVETLTLSEIPSMSDDDSIYYKEDLEELFKS